MQLCYSAVLGVVILSVCPYSCAASDKISTDLRRRASLCDSWATCFISDPDFVTRDPDFPDFVTQSPDPDVQSRVLKFVTRDPKLQSRDPDFQSRDPDLQSRDPEIKK